MVSLQLDDDKPKIGDRVKLIANHPDAGYVGQYLEDRQYYDGGQTFAIVRIDFGGRKVYVTEPDRQMRKL